MTSYNAANERMKRQYFAYLAEAQGHSEQTIDAAAKAIARFEAYTRYKDFKAFHVEQAKAFKRNLADQRGHRSGENAVWPWPSSFESPAHPVKSLTSTCPAPRAHSSSAKRHVRFTPESGHVQCTRPMSALCQ